MTMSAKRSRNRVKAEQQYWSVNEQTLGGRAENPNRVRKNLERRIGQPDSQTVSAAAFGYPVEISPPGPERPNCSDHQDDSERSEEHTSELQSLRHLVCR